MPITIQEQPNGITRVTLTGRLDIAGAAAIEVPLNLVAGSKRAVIVDVSGLEFVASMGLRSLVLTAKAVLAKQGRIVLLNPIPAVAEVITTSGVDELMPICTDEEEAVAAVILA